MKNVVKTEPVITAAAIPLLVGAVLILLVSFGIPVTPEQADAIVNVIELAIPIAMGVGAYLARRQVSPVGEPKDTSHNTHVRIEADHAGD